MIDFRKRPILVFWETTRACLLKCSHCRAEAIKEPLPGELQTDEAIRLISSLIEFGEPYPVLIMTGGDPMMRRDIFKLMEHAVNLNIRVGLAPAVSELLTEKAISRMKNIGVKYVSISLDGGRGEIHDHIRGIKGHYEETVKILKLFSQNKFITQVNTVVMRDNVYELPLIVDLLLKLKIKIWEVFFLIRVGRGMATRDISPKEYEDVLNFLYEVTRYGIEVRTVEAPFYRRIAIWRMNDAVDRSRLNVDYIYSKYSLGPLYKELTHRLLELLGPPTSDANPKIAKTRDGSGVIFIAYNGDIYPSGFAPYKLGNIRDENIAVIYRDNKILKLIRKAEFRGKCGLCKFKEICGGSRARAYVENGDILAEDPACIYIPK